MDQPIEDVLPEETGGEIELNGSFLVRPELGWTIGDPLGADDGGLLRLTSRSIDGPPGSEDARPRFELVLDGSSLLPFHFLRTGDRMGRAVLKLQREDGSTGTGFLVAPDILLSNHHVLPDEATAASCVALANFEVSPPNDRAGRPAASPLDPATLFVTNAELDFTFCGVRGLEFLGVVPLDRERMHIAASETVTIIQHPRGRPKEIALRDNRVVRADAVVVQYACDTEPGSSGSPVFNDQWKPVAIHHASVPTDSPEGRRVASGSRSRYLNEGIRLSAIALWLETAEVNSTTDRERVERLRALFGGLNPRAGFFGALGRRSHGRPAAEVVAKTYRDRLEVLDIGFWDTRVLAGMPGGLRERAADVGRVLAEFGVDIWCFSHADPATLDVICERLWAAHGLSYQPIPIGRASSPGGSCGVIVRPSKTLVAESVFDAATGLLPRVRVRARTRSGSEAEFQIAPLVSGNPQAMGLGELVHAIRAARFETPPPGPDWLLLGDAETAFAPDGLSALDESGPSILAAADSRDGAVVLIASGNSPVSQLFISPNLKPAVDPGCRFGVAHDRTLPASLHALCGPQPIALRITLDRPDMALPRPSDPPSLLDPPSLPRGAEGLDALIERKLCDLLGPVVAKLLAQAGDSGKL